MFYLYCLFSSMLYRASEITGALIQRYRLVILSEGSLNGIAMQLLKRVVPARQRIQNFEGSAKYSSRRYWNLPAAGSSLRSSCQAILDRFLHTKTPPRTVLSPTMQTSSIRIPNSCVQLTLRGCQVVFSWGLRQTALSDVTPPLFLPSMKLAQSVKSFDLDIICRFTNKQLPNTYWMGVLVALQR
jgi:hypothetical protein